MSATHDVESLLSDLATAVHRDHRRRRRVRLLGGLAVAAIVCTTGVALAGSYSDWWTGAEPPVNPGRVDRVIEENAIGLLAPDGSRKATVATTPNAALVAVATKGGGYCLIPSLTGRPSIGNSCTSAPESELRTYASPSGTTGSRVWILYGRVIDQGAASLDLRGVGLGEPVPLERGGFFLLELPQTQWAALDNRHGLAVILDASGHLLRTGCAWLGPAPGRRRLRQPLGECSATPPPPATRPCRRPSRSTPTTPSSSSPRHSLARTASTRRATEWPSGAARPLADEPATSSPSPPHPSPRSVAPTPPTH